MIAYMELLALGNAIKEALAGRSQVWLSQQSGVDQSTISRILNAKVDPTPETLEALARPLGVDPAYLMRLAGFPVPEGKYDPEISYIAQELTALPPDLRERAVDAVSGVVDSFRAMAKQRQAHEPPLTNDLAEELDRLNRSIEPKIKAAQERRQREEEEAKNNIWRTVPHVRMGYFCSYRSSSDN